MKIQNKQSYDSGIDVVRFIAFFFVFIHHFVYRGGNSISELPKTYWTNTYLDSISFFGSEGVTIFFCLSGYLLSRILIGELNKTGKLSVRSFYIRRILRIWPLYFSFVFLCLLTAPLLGNQVIKSSELPYLLSFSYNWHQLYTGDSRGMAAILWSISVEEQIYLVLPLLLLLFYRWGFEKLAISLILIGYFCRILFYLNDLSLYRNTFSYMSTIGIGMLFAIYEVKIRRWFNIHRRAGSLVSLFLIVGYVYLFKPVFSVGSLPIIAFDITAMMSIFLLLILGGSERKQTSRFLKLLAYFGRRTYGMYILHWPILALMVSRSIFFDDATGISFQGLVFAFVLVAAISSFSYRFFEKPFLDLRKRYQFIKVG
jgi:peptidoglycan/LPS O-acetylase OafA/YrhL